jgi:hypothetical protein
MFRMPFRRDRKPPPDETPEGQPRLGYRSREEDERDREADDDSADGFIDPKANLKAVRTMFTGCFGELAAHVIGFAFVAAALVVWLSCR